mmetsp:Transcript_32923/g.72301  ORF Transcript_32923/g.72301 Transcript_32923/m.72301 type:complete len:216 (+) Transcript_32923:102-749(+)
MRALMPSASRPLLLRVSWRALVAAGAAASDTPMRRGARTSTARRAIAAFPKLGSTRSRAFASHEMSWLQRWTSAYPWLLRFSPSKMKRKAKSDTASCTPENATAGANTRRYVATSSRLRAVRFSTSQLEPWLHSSPTCPRREPISLTASRGSINSDGEVEELFATAQQEGDKERVACRKDTCRRPAAWLDLERDGAILLVVARPCSVRASAASNS